MKSIRDKILKSIRALKNFTVDDIELITGLDRSEILRILKELPVKQSGDSYVFCAPEKTYSHSKKEKYDRVNNLKQPEIYRIKIPEFSTRELTIYNSAPEGARRKGDIYLRIIRLSGGFNGKKLKDFIRYWNESYPDKRVTYYSVMRARKKLKEEGLLGLLSKYYPHNKGKSNVNEDMYSMFKDLYLRKDSPTACSCYEKVKQKYLNPDEEWSFPSYQSFLRRIKREFSKKEIDSLRRV